MSDGNSEKMWNGFYNTALNARDSKRRRIRTRGDKHEEGIGRKRETKRRGDQ